MHTFHRSRGPRLLAALAVVGLLAAACGGGASQAPAATPSGGTPQPGGGYTGPETTISYSIWGDPAELKSQQAIVDAFHAANPKITVDVIVSDWDAVLGQAPDGARRRRRARRLRDGRPALPGLPVAGRPPRPQAVHRPRRLRPDPAGRPGRRRLHDVRWRPVRPPARPQHDRALLQQDDVRRGRPGLPRRELGLGEARRGRHGPHEGRERRRHRRPVGLLHRDDRHGELLELARLAERRRHRQRRQDEDAPRDARGGRRDPVPPGPDLEGQDHGRPGALRRDGRRLRAGQRGHGGERVMARPDPHRGRERPRVRVRHRPAARRDRPGATPRSTRPAPSSTRARRRPTRRGSS